MSLVALACRTRSRPCSRSARFLPPAARSADAPPCACASRSSTEPVEQTLRLAGASDRQRSLADASDNNERALLSFPPISPIPSTETDGSPRRTGMSFGTDAAISARLSAHPATAAPAGAPSIRGQADAHRPPRPGKTHGRPARFGQSPLGIVDTLRSQPGQGLPPSLGTGARSRTQRERTVGSTASSSSVTSDEERPRRRLLQQLQQCICRAAHSAPRQAPARRRAVHHDVSPG